MDWNSIHTVLKRESKGEVLDLQIPALTCGHELWVMTENEIRDTSVRNEFLSVWAYPLVAFRQKPVLQRLVHGCAVVLGNTTGRVFFLLLVQPPGSSVVIGAFSAHTPHTPISKE